MSRKDIENYKIITDAIHDQIILHPLLIKIIQTSEFSRLKYIKQLAILFYVYPCATHTRFEHSLGTCHLAGEFIRHLKKIQGQEYNINETDVLCIEIAGLLHDVGHGPFSHLFEKVVGGLINKTWKHETMSIKIIDKLYNDLKNDFHQYGIKDLEIEFIKDLILFDDQNGDEKMKKLNDKWRKKYEEKGLSWNKVFMFEIVSNHRNGIDVDKFDYFERDSLNLGFKSNFQKTRYILSSHILVVNDLPQICLRNAVAGNLYEMFHIREQLHRNAYQHKVCMGIELMVVEALIKADKYFKFKDIIEKEDVTRYCALTDSVFQQILNIDTIQDTYINSPYIDSETRKRLLVVKEQILDDLNQSRQLLKRIQDRKLYKFISQVSCLKPEETETEDEIQEKVLEYYNKTVQNVTEELTCDDICLLKVKFNYGYGNKNPIDNVKFYRKNEYGLKFQLVTQQVSLMLPERFEEVVLRLYCKKCNNEEKTIYKKLNEAFNKWRENEEKVNQGLYTIPLNAATSEASSI